MESQLKTPLRLKSPSRTTVTQVTVADFHEAFDNTLPDETLNAETLPQRLEELNNVLIDPDYLWSMKTKQLIALRGCLIAPFPEAIEIVSENYALWEQCLIEGLKELRSTLTKEYCITIAFFAMKLGNQMLRQIELMLPNLMNLVQNSAKIISSSATILSEFIAQYVHHGKLMTLTSSHLVSKSNAVRKNVVHMFNVMVSHWDSSLLKQHINMVKEVIEKGLNDADLACRTTSRFAYYTFCEKFPDHGKELYDALDPVRQKALNSEKTGASASQSVVLVRKSSSAVKSSPFLHRSKSDMAPLSDALRSTQSCQSVVKAIPAPLTSRATPLKSASKIKLTPRKETPLRSASINIKDSKQNLVATQIPKPRLRDSMTLSSPRKPMNDIRRSITSIERGTIPASITASLDDLTSKIGTMEPQEIYEVFEECKNIVLKRYEHPESMVRKAVIFFFVAISNSIGTEPLLPLLSPIVFKLVEKYRIKTQKKDQ